MKHPVRRRLTVLTSDIFIVVLAAALIHGWQIPTWYLWFLIGGFGLGVVIGIIYFLSGLILMIGDPSFEWEIDR